MPDVFTIRTGTRDELAGVEISVVNVVERDERPGQLSVQLILPDRHFILAIGDEVDVAGVQFRLLSITPDRGAYEVEVQQVTKAAPAPSSEPSNLPIPPVDAGDLCSVLRAVTPAILAHLARGASVPDLLGWQAESRQTVDHEWNGGEIGPNTTRRELASFAPATGPEVEASVTMDELRYDPAEIYRREVSAYWRFGDADAHVFLRAEGSSNFDHITGDSLDPGVLRLIRDALASLKR